MSKQHSEGFLALVAEAKSRIKELSALDLQQRDASYVLLDVREDHEWQAGYLPNAVHLGRGILERDVERLYPKKQQEIIVYCAGGFRSALAADVLGKMGYSQVWSLAGGYRAWVAAGFGVEQLS